MFLFCYVCALGYKGGIVLKTLTFLNGKVVLKTMGPILCVSVTFFVLAVNNRCSVTTKTEDPC